MSLEVWRMASGRGGAIDLSQPAEAVEALRALLRSQGATQVEDTPQSPIQAFAADEYDEARRRRAEQKETPARQGEGSEITSTHEKEQNMTTTDSTTTTAPSAEEIREAIQQVFDDIERIGPVVQLLPEHPLHQDIPAVKTRTVDLIDDEEILVGAGWYWWATVLDREGNDVSGMPQDYWNEALGTHPLHVRRQFQATENAAMRLGASL